MRLQQEEQRVAEDRRRKTVTFYQERYGCNGFEELLLQAQARNSIPLPRTDDAEAGKGGGGGTMNRPSIAVAVPVAQAGRHA